jgi:hypothetical protein
VRCGVLALAIRGVHARVGVAARGIGIESESGSRKGEPLFHPVVTATTCALAVACAFVFTCACAAAWAAAVAWASTVGVGAQVLVGAGCPKEIMMLPDWHADAINAITNRTTNACELPPKIKRVGRTGLIRI